MSDGDALILDISCC